MKKGILIALITLPMLLLGCDKNKTSDETPTFNIVGTTWIAQDGIFSSSTTYYLYNEATMLENGKISANVWKSQTLLYLSNVTNLSESGCELFFTENGFTYSYNYPEVSIYDKTGKFVGKATLAADNKTATLLPTNSSYAPITYFAIRPF